MTRKKPTGLLSKTKMDIAGLSSVHENKDDFKISFTSPNGLEFNPICTPSPGYRPTGKPPRRSHIGSLMRSSAITARVSTTSATTFISVEASVPILGDGACKSTSPGFPMVGTPSGTPRTNKNDHERLCALRDVVGSIKAPNGFIDRATFSKAFEVDCNNFKDYNNESNDMIDADALLVDACLEMNLEEEEKLQFIFELIDTNKKGRITKEQVMKLLKSNFATAKIDLVGTNYDDLASILFKKVNATTSINLDEFCQVFKQYLNHAYPELQVDENVTSEDFLREDKSAVRHFYDNHRLRIWWLSIYAILNISVFVYKWNCYSYCPVVGYGLQLARGCAQVIMLNFLLVLLPMCRSITAVMKRNNLFWEYIPFDDHIEFHKLCGIVLCTAGFIHTGAHISNEIYLFLVAPTNAIEGTIWQKNIPAFKNGLPSFLVVLKSLPVWTGVILLIIMLIAFPIAAIPSFRQGNFNLFWFSHMLFFPFLVLGSIHGALSWLATAQSYLWIWPPLVIYLVERRFRYAKIFTTPVRIKEAHMLDGTLALYMDTPKRFVYRPGMYTFLNVPQISSHEWHPFTISSAPGDNYISLHIRNAGDWTDALHNLIIDCHQSKREYPKVFLDGPVGAPTQDYQRYKTIVMVGGGIGVTPFASILKDVVHLWEAFRCRSCLSVNHPETFKIQKMYFHWVTRGQESLGWFEKTMQSISSMDKDNIIETHQYLTSVKNNDNSATLKMFQALVHGETGKDIVSGMNTKQMTHFGRPNWDQIFLDLTLKHPGEEIGVFFCGPHALDKILNEKCLKYSKDINHGGTEFDYHSEKFA